MVFKVDNDTVHIFVQHTHADRKYVYVGKEKYIVYICNGHTQTGRSLRNTEPPTEIKTHEPSAAEQRWRAADGNVCELHPAGLSATGEVTELDIPANS